MKPNAIFAAITLAVSGCAAVTGQVEPVIGTHMATTLGEVNQACLDRRLAEECSANPGSMECNHPRLLRECYEQNVVHCKYQLSTSGDDVVFGPDYECVRFVIPARQR